MIAGLSIVEAMGSRHPQRPFEVALIVIVGFLAIWRAFTPQGTCLTDIPRLIRERRSPTGPASGSGLQTGSSG
jgi:hypothetical protein